MARRRNTVQDESTVREKTKLKKIFQFTAGQTKSCDKKILRELKDKGAKIVEDVNKCHVIIVFCPIVSRLESDIHSALSELKEKVLSGLTEEKRPKIILVAMHHTRKKDFIVPIKKDHNYNGDSILVVHCLFFEEKGLLDCAQNKSAIKNIKTEMKLKKHKCIIL